MSNTDNDPDIDSEILQMGLVVSDAEVEGNKLFNEEMDSDHDGSELPALIDPLSNESTLERSVVADILMSLNDQVSFTFGSSLQPLTANHDPINYLEQRSVVPRRLLQSTKIPINRINMNNNTSPEACSPQVSPYGL